MQLYRDFRRQPSQPRTSCRRFVGNAGATTDRCDDDHAIEVGYGEQDELRGEASGDHPLGYASGALRGELG